MGAGGGKKKRKTKTEILTKFAIFQCPQDSLIANFTSYSEGSYFRHNADLKTRAPKKKKMLQ